MFSKLSVVCIAALAVVTQAGHGQHHTHSHKNGTLTQHPFHDYEHKPSASAGYPGEAGISSGVAPYPAGTGGYSSLSTGASPGLLTTGVPVPTSMTTGFPTLNQSGDTTLTYVIGSGSSTTTVVTTIHHTSYQTNYNSVYTSAGQPGEGGENGASGPPGGYQTVHETIHPTMYVTVASTAGSGAGSLGEGGVTGSACAAPVTVTVTGPEQTVTVTATSTPGSSSPPFSTVVGTPVSSAVVSSSAPYGMNNGTQPTGTGASTGFLTKRSASFTLKPSSTIAGSLGVAFVSGTAPSSLIVPSSGVASPSGTIPSSSSSVSPTVMATAVMQAYN